MTHFIGVDPAVPIYKSILSRDQMVDVLVNALTDGDTSTYDSTQEIIEKTLKLYESNLST